MADQYIQLDETPECVQVLVVFQDGHEEHWDAGINASRKIVFYPPESMNEDESINTPEELKDMGVKRLYVEMTDTIDVDTLE